MNFYIKLSIFVLSIALVIFPVYFHIVPQYYLNIVPYTLLFFTLMSIINHIVTKKRINQKMVRFSTMLMAVTFAKLFIYLIFMVIIVLTDKNAARLFIVPFLFFFLLFIVFDTVTLLQSVSVINKEKK